MTTYNSDKHYIDFSNHNNLTDSEKSELELIQQKYYPIERTEFLMEYYLNGKINDDEYETMTTVQFQYIDE